MSLKLLGLTVVFLIFALVCGYFGFGAVHQKNQAEALSTSGVTTSGQIVDVVYIRGPKTVTYSYSVSGKTYESKSQVTTLHNLRRGDIVTVYYLPSEPATSEIDITGVVKSSTQVLQIVGLASVILIFCYFLGLAIVRQDAR